MTIKNIIDFFEANNCIVEFEPSSKGFIYDIWSKISKRWILQDANETQLINFYNKNK
jgi:hypothetical protein